MQASKIAGGVYTLLFQKIMQSSIIYKHIIDNMHDGVLTVDCKGQISSINPAGEKILEMNQTDIVGKKYVEIFLGYPQNDDFNQTILDAVYESSNSHHKIVDFYTGTNLKSLFLTTSFLKAHIENEIETIGIVAVFSDITELQELKDASIAMEKIKSLNTQLERLSYLDALTNIPNRRFFDESLSREWKRAVRNQEPLSLIIIDVDYFKEFNDTFGHQQADQCLIQIAAVLSQSIKRASDFAARYGGDEFAVILPKTHLEAAHQIAQKMQHGVIDLHITHPGSPNGLATITLGVACINPTTENSPETLFTAADQALYRAKKAGRNKIGE